MVQVLQIVAIQLLTTLKSCHDCHVPSSGQQQSLGTLFSSLLCVRKIPYHCTISTSLHQVMVESWIQVIYANFSTHYQHVRTETRIYQAAWTFSHLILMITMITCLLLSHLILSCRASSSAVHLLQHAKSCLF